MSGLESARSGDELYRQSRESISEPLPLTDNRVQIALAELAYPDAAKPTNIWALGDEASGASALSGPFREHIESIDMKEIDIKDPQAMSELLEAVRARARSALH